MILSLAQDKRPSWPGAETSKAVFSDKSFPLQVLPPGVCYREDKSDRHSTHSHTCTMGSNLSLLEEGSQGRKGGMSADVPHTQMETFRLWKG